jgi:hypothetical protein
MRRRDNLEVVPLPGFSCHGELMNFYWLLLGILSVWRISYLLAAETGPWDFVEHIRHSLGNGFWREVMSCLYCVSVWVALPFAYVLGESWKQRALLWPALSAGAIIVERCIHREKAEAAAYIEDREVPESSKEYEAEDYSNRNQENGHVLRQR